jgi:hypothetical protein
MVRLAEAYRRLKANLYALSFQRLFSERRVEYGAVGPLLLSEYLLVPGGEEIRPSILAPITISCRLSTTP